MLYVLIVIEFDHTNRVFKLDIITANVVVLTLGDDRPSVSISGDTTV